MRIAVPDLVSNSYFPAVAAAALGAFAAEGLDIKLELVSPLPDCIKALRDGIVDFIGASAHAPLLAFPEWHKAKLLCAQSQGTYWLLVMRRDLNIARGELDKLKGKRIAAVPFVGAALRQLLLELNIDPVRDEIEICMPSAATKPGVVNFGVFAARALRDGEIDGFFANGMGAEVALRDGIGNLVLDVRRGDGPEECFHYTMPSIATTDVLISEQPDAAAGVVRAIIKTQAALKREIGLATKVGRKLFQPREAKLIADVVARDLPFYDPAISEASVVSMKRYSRAIGLLSGDPSYEEIVAARFRGLWSAAA
jgi:ABC-type nitrate/sulfonate/bicarbonate transport system substrate-binding protein